MAGWDFPTSHEVGGIERRIRNSGDFRLVLDVMGVLTDDTITEEERAYVALSVFYADVDPLELDQEQQRDAIDWMLWFIRGGHDKEGTPGPRLMDWDQDFKLLAPPVNRVLGYECRSCDYLHWWTFLGAYMEIGDCYFAQVVSIRSKKARGKKLDKSDQEFYRKHRRDIDLKVQMSAEEEELVRRWTVHG